MDSFDASGLWWLLLLSLVVYIATLFFRKYVEFALPGAKNHLLWTEIILPTFPEAFGVGFILLAKTYPLPFTNPSVLLRAILGLVAGFLSSKAYRTAMAIIKMKTGANVTDEDK